MDVFDDIIGQDQPIAVLRASAARPVHAYLLVGPHTQDVATDFAASLLCPTAGHHDGDLCDSCRRVRNGLHPDVVQVERVGASISIEAARAVVRTAFLSPVEGPRKVVVLHDFHLVKETGPALLKTIEEPPATTVFVILAEFLPPELVTIASRCVRVDFGSPDIAAALRAEGVDPERAEVLAVASGGRLDRARLLARDAKFESRQNAWTRIPEDLDGSGATAARLADRLIALMDESVAPLKESQSAEVEELVERNRRNAEVVGSKKAKTTKAVLNAGLSDLEDRHRREQRRQRTDELRGGLAALARTYRSMLGTARRNQAVAAVTEIDRLAKSLEFNPNETIALQALLARLGRLVVS